MPIHFHIEADTVAELANEFANLAEVFGSRASAPEAAAPAPVPAPAAAPKKAAKKTDTKLPEGEALPDYLAKDGKAFQVFKATGELFSNFADGEKALDRIKQEIAACANSHDLNKFAGFNMATVEKLSAKQQDEYQELLDDRINELTEEENGEAETITFEVAEASLKGFITSKGILPGREILKELGAKGFKDISAKQYPKMMQLIKDKS